MNLKQSVYIPATPIPTHLLEQQEEQYLQRLGHSMTEVLASLQATAADYSEKYIRRDECERLVEEKQQVIAVLQSENYQLRVAAEQFQRCLKRCEMKQDLLNNKVYHLTKAIAEKDAIIKYLEGKALPAQPTPPPPSLPPRNVNDSLHQVSRTYSKSNLSFAKLKSTTNIMTFEDYANNSLQLPSDPTKRIKEERVRTESSDVKQNESTGNMSSGMGKLVGFFSSGMFGSVENQKTLTKAQSNLTQQNASFWQYSKPSKPEGRDQRRHSNFTSYMAQPHPRASFYHE